MHRISGPEVIRRARPEQDAPVPEPNAALIGFSRVPVTPLLWGWPLDAASALGVTTTHSPLSGFEQSSRISQQVHDLCRFARSPVVVVKLSVTRARELALSRLDRNVADSVHKISFGSRLLFCHFARPDLECFAARSVDSCKQAIERSRCGKWVEEAQHAQTISCYNRIITRAWARRLRRPGDAITRDAAGCGAAGRVIRACGESLCSWRARGGKFKHCLNPRASPAPGSAERNQTGRAHVASTRW